MASGKSSFIFFRIRARVVQSVKYDDTLEDKHSTICVPLFGLL